MDKHRLLSERQYEFVEGKSTEDAIREMTTFIYNGLDKIRQKTYSVHIPRFLESIRYGPQGTFLGPLLFLLYVNDLNMNILGSIFSFADDLSISYEAESWEQVKLKAEKDIQSISD